MQKEENFLSFFKNLVLTVTRYLRKERSELSLGRLSSSHEILVSYKGCHKSKFAPSRKYGKIHKFEKRVHLSKANKEFIVQFSGQ